jgi:hypothetical protein
MSSPRHLQAWRNSSWSRRSAARFRLWSPHELQQLRTLAEEGVPLKCIAATLRRSEYAVRNKAGIHGISLKLPTSTE